MILEIFDYEEGLSPISVFSSARDHFGGPCALLESGFTDDSNQFSLIACVPIQEIESHKNSFEKLKKSLSKTIPFPKNFPFSGGLIGYFNFEIFGEIEPKFARESDYPHALFYEFSRFFAFDHAQKKIFAIQTTPERDNFITENKKILKKARAMKPEVVELDQLKTDKFLDFSAFESEQTEATFGEKVSWAKEKILNGEIFQIIISNGFRKNVGLHDGLEFYQVLRKLEPTTHLVFFDFKQHGQVCGASPEILGSKRGKKVVYCPIAGTRYRGKNKTEDTTIFQEMAQDPKENAEHDMLVDLGRNDLGKICEPQSIHVEKEKYGRIFANLMHMVSDISGAIRDEFDTIDFFKAIFPAGTLTGAPKIRAIDLIYQTESNPRNLYGGAMGYFSADDNMEFCIAIRSFFLKDGIARFRTGAGIVQDSEKSKEWLEVHNKAKSLCKIFNYVLRND